MKKLHLGCGCNYLEGYTNIDFPQSETVQNRTRKPDIEGNFLEIDYPKNYFTEIRLHHVFEHFQRQEAVRLLCDWNSYLEFNGISLASHSQLEKLCNG
jgi:predicted SAM-dependent methyltransferase